MNTVAHCYDHPKIREPCIPSSISGSFLWNFVWLTMATILLVAISACGAGGGGGGGGGGNGNEVEQGPTGTPQVLFSSTLLYHCGYMPDNVDMVFAFDRAMDPDSYEDLREYESFPFGDVLVPAWNDAHTTLTFPRPEMWTIGGGTWIRFKIEDLDGNEAVVVATPNIWDGNGMAPYSYVKGAAEGGNDANDGLTPATAYATLLGAQDSASLTLVAATATAVPGMSPAVLGYVADQGGDTQNLDLTNGQSYCGGFNTAFTERNPAKHETVIADNRAIGGAQGNPTSTVYSNETTEPVILDGFTLVAAGPAAVAGFDTTPTVSTAVVVAEGFTTAVFSHNTFKTGGSPYDVGLSLHGVDAPGPTFLSNRITFQGTSSTSHGVMAVNAAVMIEDNTIGPATATTGANGITIDGTEAPDLTPNVTITRNTIEQRSAPSTLGIEVTYNLDGTVVISDNAAIHGGNATEMSAGIMVGQANDVEIEENELIDGGTGGMTWGIGISPDSSGVVVANNAAIVGGTGQMSFGVLDMGVSSEVRYNTINGGGGGSETVSIGLATSLFGDGAFATGTASYESNTISGGNGATAVGVLLGAEGSTAMAYLGNNVISGCGMYGTPPPENCSGVVIIDGASVIVYLNTINGGSGSVGSTAVQVLGALDGVSIDSNLLFTSVGGMAGATPGATCVATDDGIAQNITMFNNDLFACGAQLYVDSGGIHGLDDNINMNGTDGIPLADLGHVSVDPQFVKMGSDPGRPDVPGMVDWHLQATSPASVRGGGTYGSCGDQDRDGEYRTTDDSNGAAGGASMGAYRSPVQYLFEGC